MPNRRRPWTAVLGVAVLLGAAVVPRGAPPVAARGAPAAARVVTGVSLVNDATGRPVLGLSPLTDGTVLDAAAPAGRSLRAGFAPGVRPGGVTYTMRGTDGGGTAHTAPAASGFRCDTTGCPLLARPGRYTLSVQAVTGAGDPLGAPRTVRLTVAAAAPATDLDVLFVGNSLLGTVNRTSGEDTPALVRRLAAAAGRTVTVTEVIRSGYTLRRTWDDGLVAAALSGARRYDAIVLQEYSTLLATDPAAATDTLLHRYAPTFGRALKPGGRVVLFKNWALADPAPFPSRAAATAAIDAHAADLSAALAAARDTPHLFAPIGDAFETVIAARGTAYLITADGKHPTDTAVYLDAAVLCGVLLRASPRDLDDLYVPAPAAAYLRAVAATATGW
ncbi:hypothetical protein Daura_37715 [Dactylosporangium aurantiacum]|uniref:Uncharacterized protein n=1 Tax=Dactylosporangium aurantiacum TaxID=35754 RepID=A0A9Q9IDH2_9ACTN|nr:hypothetical protein [Dactylosporangium aurantiacum]MDG6101843.1 hypothetical protein [Dactylosporangium aurantiacum]UWZ52355.1 hypothetical protein Daura_37715 [Dactylosporangium aurantiacum]